MLGLDLLFNVFSWKRHLWLWRKVSLNDKYDRICNHIQFYLIFRVYYYVLMDKSMIFRYSFFGCGPCFDWHDNQICILKQKLLILTANCMVYFTHFYTHGNQIYTFRQLDTCLTTIIIRIRIQLMLQRYCKVFFFINCKGTFQRYEPFFALPTCSPPWPSVPLWYIVWCVKRTC